MITDTAYAAAVEYVNHSPLPTWRGFREWCDRCGTDIGTDIPADAPDADDLTQRLLDLHNGWEVESWRV
jgi:hypothetical protein